MDSRSFRDALAQFATGVTIVTARTPSGERVGTTVSSFNSLSLDPPMILWSLDKRALSRQAFEAATHFAVHVLTADQEDLARRFGKRGVDKFRDLECASGTGGTPLISDCAACFECETRHRYDGGDHVIFVGQVVNFSHSAGTPLVFHSGAFTATQRTPRLGAPDSTIDENTGRFGPDFVSYLVARAHFQLYVPLVRAMKQLDISETDYFTLSVLCIRDGLNYEGIAAFLEHTGHAPSEQHVSDMIERNLVARVATERVQVLSVTELGRRIYVTLLALDGRQAVSALSGFSTEAVVELTRALRRIIANTDPGVPDLWRMNGEAH